MQLSNSSIFRTWNTNNSSLSYKITIAALCFSLLSWCSKTPWDGLSDASKEEINNVWWKFQEICNNNNISIWYYLQSFPNVYQEIERQELFINEWIQKEYNTEDFHEKVINSNMEPYIKDFFTRYSLSAIINKFNENIIDIRGNPLIQRTLEDRNKVQKKIRSSWEKISTGTWECREDWAYYCANDSC